MMKGTKKNAKRLRRGDGRGGKVIDLSRLDPQLVLEAFAYAKRKNITLKEVFERALRTAMGMKP